MIACNANGLFTNSKHHCDSDAWSLFEIIADADPHHGFKFDCNQEATLVRRERPLIKTSIIVPFSDDS